MEKETKEQATSSSSTLATKSKYKGKVFLENPTRNQPSQMIETLHKGAEFKKTLETLSSQLREKTGEVESQPKKQKTRLVPEQVQVQQALVSHPQPMPK